MFIMDSDFSSMKLEIWECFIVFTLFEQVQRNFFWTFGQSNSHNTYFYFAVIQF